jgi:hypothetical protein
MTFVDINTTVVQQGASDLSEVGQKIGQGIANATEAQTAIQGYESPERAPKIKQYLVQFLEAAPAIQKRVQEFSTFLEGVATTYNSMG